MNQNKKSKYSKYSKTFFFFFFFFFCKVSVTAFDKESCLTAIPLRRVLFERIATHIETQYRTVDGIFRISGAHTTVVALYCTFSHVNIAAIPLDSCTAHVVSGALKLWLRENPLLTTHVRRNLLNAVRQIRVADSELLSRDMSVAAPVLKDTNEFALLRESLSLLRADDAAILQRLVLLLRRVSEKSSINRMGPRNLAIVFAPNLMRALDPASAVVESELEIDAIEIFIRCCDQLYREPYIPVSIVASSSSSSAAASSSSADAAAADDGSTDPLAAFPCRWMKRNGKVEIFESSFVHVSNKLLKSKRARVFLNDIVEISANADAKSLSSASLSSNTMGRSSTDAASSSAATSSGTARSASVGGASAVPPPLGSLRNMSSLLHEVRSRAGVVGKFVLRLTLRQGAVVTTVVTIGSQRDINREVGDFVLLVFDSQVSMKEAAALLERLRREPWRTALSPRRIRARASQHQLNDDAAHSGSNRTSDGDGGESKSTLNTLRVPSSERAPLSLSVDALSSNSASTNTSSQSPPSSPTTGARTTPPATTWLDVRSRSPPARRPKHPAPVPTRVESTPLVKSTSPRDSGSAKDSTTKRAATLTKHSATSTSSTDVHAAAPLTRRKKKRGSNSAKADDVVATSDDSSSSN
jgi:hypothetical protein